MFCTSTAEPSVFVIDRSAIGPSVLVSVAELFVVVGSFEPTGAATEAVLLSEPDPVGEIEAANVNVTEPPTGTFTVALIEPDPDAGQNAPTLAEHVHVAALSALGSVSVTVAPVAAEGPAFVTRIVYEIEPPGAEEPEPSVLVMARSDVTRTVSVSVAELLPGVGSVTPTGAAMVAVLASEPVAVGLTDAESVYVAVPPTSRLTVSLMLPVPDGTQLEPADAVQVHAALVSVAGSVSVTAAPVTIDGPLFVAMIV